MADDPFTAIAVDLNETAKIERKKRGAKTPEVAPTEAVAEETADMPEEDTETARERRLERLIGIVADADFAGNTALGDMRDLVLDLFKARDKPWHLMDANERNDMGRHIEKVSKGIISRVVQAVAEEDSSTVSGTLQANFTVKGDALEIKVKIEQADEDGLLHVHRLAGHRVVIVDACDRRFQNERRPGPSGEQQVAMEFEDAGPTPPDDDGDLAGEEGED